MWKSWQLYRGILQTLLAETHRENDVFSLSLNRHSAVHLVEISIITASKRPHFLFMKLKLQIKPHEVDANSEMIVVTHFQDTEENKLPDLVDIDMRSSYSKEEVRRVICRSHSKQNAWVVSNNGKFHWGCSKNWPVAELFTLALEADYI